MRLISINGGSTQNTTVSDDKATYTFKFPAGSIKVGEGDKVCLNNLSMYYSWPSITSSQGNNTFSYVWPNDTQSPYTVTIPDGFYTVDELNAFLQYTMIENEHYMKDSNGDYVYFFNLSENSTKYAVQLDVTSIPTSAEATEYGWTISADANFWSLPTSSTYPQLYVPSSSSSTFCNIIGFTGGKYYPDYTTPTTSTTNEAAIEAYTSDFTPQVTPTSSVVLTCSLINNSFNNPSDMLYTFGPNVTYGSQINLDPATKTWVDATPGTFNEVSITFKDQSYNKLAIKDTNLIVQLGVMDKKEYLRV